MAPQKKPLGAPAGSASHPFSATGAERHFPLDRRLPVAPQICEVLRNLILNLELEPGAVISKDAVARAFGISSMPVREALRKLEEEGLVIIKPQSGTYVTTIDVQGAREAQFLRIGVEVEVIRKLVETVTDENIRELEAILRHHRFTFEIDDKKAFSQDDMAFHAAMYRMVGVGGLWQKIGTLRVHIDRLRLIHLPLGGKMSRILSGHEDILDAIRARDADRAEAALREHLSETLSFVETFRSRYPHYF